MLQHAYGSLYVARQDQLLHSQIEYGLGFVHQPIGASFGQLAIGFLHFQDLFAVCFDVSVQTVEL